MISGYRQLSDDELAAIEQVKAWELLCGSLFAQLAALPGVDKRCLAIARTDLQQASMWMTRAVAKPEEYICAP